MRRDGREATAPKGYRNQARGHQRVRAGVRGFVDVVGVQKIGRASGVYTSGYFDAKGPLVASRRELQGRKPAADAVAIKRDIHIAYGNIWSDAG